MVVCPQIVQRGRHPAVEAATMKPTTSAVIRRRCYLHSHAAAGNDGKAAVTMAGKTASVVAVAVVAPAVLRTTATVCQKRQQQQ